MIPLRERRHTTAPSPHTRAGLKRILLVEDNPYDVELALAALEEQRLNSQVAVTHDGVDALDYLHGRGRFEGDGSALPAVVLLDLKMPRMDGLEVLGHLKSDPELCRVPVVMLTSSREERDLARSYELGANAYIVKPVDFTEYVRTVKDLGRFWAVLNEPPPPVAGAPAPGEPALPHKAKRPWGHGECVLVVADEVAMREIIQATLEKHGYRILTAHDGTEGLSAFMRHRAEISVIITDMMMPIMDGAALIRALLKVDPATKLVAISGLIENEKVAGLGRPGQIVFMQKSFTTEKLLVTINDLLSARVRTPAT